MVQLDHEYGDYSIDCAKCRCPLPIQIKQVSESTHEQESVTSLTSEMVKPHFNIHILLRCLTLVTLITISQSAKILVLIPFSGEAHYYSTRPIGLELARRGHDVYVVTANVETEHPPTYHQVVIEYKPFWELLGGTRTNIFDMKNLNFAQFMKTAYEFGIIYTNFTLASPELQKFMSLDHKFDVVISELFYQEATYMFAHLYSAPLVLLSIFGNSFKTNYFSRNPPQLSTLIHEYGLVTEPGSFMGRLENLYYCLHDYLLMKIFYLPEHEQLVKRYFKNLPQPIPTLQEIKSNVSLILLNSHFSADGAATYLPNVIEIGGIHIKDTDNTLPQDLQEFLDSAVDGAVLVSFGTTVRSSDLSIEKKEAFLKVLGRLKQKVVWKWEEPELSGKPENVLIKTWLPQKEILAHPNVRLFIAHGGLLGLQEALHYGVPILGVPIYGDQFNNLLRAKEGGYAEIIDYDNIDEEILNDLVTKMLTDDTYFAKAKEISKRYKDRPMSSLDTAMFWIEYVIRNKGASHMKSPGLKMNVLAFYMVDIEIFFILIFILCVFAICKLKAIIVKRNRAIVSKKKL